MVLKALTPETQYSVYVEAATLTARSKSQESFFKTQKIGEEALSLLWNKSSSLWIDWGTTTWSNLIGFIHYSP